MDEKRRMLPRSFRRFEGYEVCSDEVDDASLKLAEAAARRHPQHIRLGMAQAQTVTSSSPALL